MPIGGLPGGNKPRQETEAQNMMEIIKSITYHLAQQYEAHKATNDRLAEQTAIITPLSSERSCDD